MQPIAIHKTHIETRNWTAKEKQRAVEMADSGLSYRSIGKALNRTYGAVHSTIYKTRRATK